MFQYLYPGSAAFDICPTAEPGFISAPTSRSCDDVVKSISLLKITRRYPLWPGHTSDEFHPFHDFSQAFTDASGASVYLPPTLTTHYGHELIAPYGITITVLGQDTRKTRMVMITLHRADQDAARELTVAAWQGDNDTFHLVDPLPDEDELFGPVKRTLFGKPPESAEKREWTLGQLYYGDTALLDVDISKIITPGKILRA